MRMVTSICKVLTIIAGELKVARDEGDAVIHTLGKMIVLVDGARPMSLPRKDRIVILIYRTEERVVFARIVARVNGVPFPE